MNASGLCSSLCWELENLGDANPNGRRLMIGVDVEDVLGPTRAEEIHILGEIREAGRALKG